MRLIYFVIISVRGSELPWTYRAEALFNAVKKQYGLHSYFLPLTLPTDPPPNPVNVPLPTPRLPSISSMAYSPIPPTQVPSTLQTVSDSTPLPPSLTNGSREPQQLLPPSPAPPFTPGQLNLNEGDIQQTGRFVREFAVMSLLPWMEKCVVDWNEVVRIFFDPFWSPANRLTVCSLACLCSIHLQEGCRRVSFHLRDVYLVQDTPTRHPRPRRRRMGVIPPCRLSHRVSRHMPQTAQSALLRPSRQVRARLGGLSRSKGGLQSSLPYLAITNLP